LGALASSRDTAFGTTVTFTCPVGQEFATGLARITAECMLGGNWSVTYIPPCQGKYYKSFQKYFFIISNYSRLYHKVSQKYETNKQKYVY
jgi:hypothetical protein